MSIERFHAGARMSQAVNNTAVLCIAGQLARLAPGALVSEQTADILARTDGLLAEAGTDKSKAMSRYT